jgi:thiol-disulfide isomerase/thioredoxin
LLLVVSIAGCATARPTGELAPRFVEYTLKGETAGLDPGTMSRPMLLAFWATWCASCQRELPSLISLYEEKRGQLDIIGVNVDKDVAKAQTFAVSERIPYDSVIDAELRISDLFEVKKTPTFVLVDRSGRIAYTGVDLDDHLRAAVDQALK